MNSSETPKAKPGQYLTFILRGQTYGVPIGAIREINQITDISVVPETPSFVAGVINLRGKVIPVIDLRLKFSMPIVERTRDSCIIIIQNDTGTVGVIVDAVSSVVDFSPAQLEPTPVMGEKAKLSFIIGMGKSEGKVIILLDIVAALLTEDFIETYDLRVVA